MAERKILQAGSCCQVLACQVLADLSPSRRQRGRTHPQRHRVAFVSQMRLILSVAPDAPHEPERGVEKTVLLSGFFARFFEGE